VQSACILAALVSIAGAPTTTTRLAVLPIVIEGPRGSASLSSIFNDVASVTERRLGLRIISYEEMFAAAEEGLRDKVRECGSSTSCISSRLRVVNARLALVVLVDFKSKTPLISLQLLDTDSSTLVQDYVGELKTPATLSQEIRSRASELLEKAGYRLAAQVTVDVDPPSARVTFGQGIEPDQGTHNRFTVAPGHYEVSASQDGWSTSSSAVTVDSGGEAHLKLALVKESSIIQSPWLWIGVGLAVVGGTAAVLIATRKTDRFFCSEPLSANCPQ
jgi:hypothetical protein